MVYGKSNNYCFKCFFFSFSNKMNWADISDRPYAAVFSDISLYLLPFDLIF